VSENKPYAFQVSVRKFSSLKNSKVSPYVQQLVLAAKSNVDRGEWLSAMNIAIQDFYVGLTMNQIVSVDSGIMKWAELNSFPDVIKVFNGLLGDVNEPNSVEK
jgi:hypothetical protein